MQKGRGIHWLLTATRSFCRSILPGLWGWPIWMEIQSGSKLAESREGHLKNNRVKGVLLLDEYPEEKLMGAVIFIV